MPLIHGNAMLSHAAHSWQCRVNTCHAFATWIWIQSTQARHPACEAHQNAHIRPCSNIMKAGVVPLVRCRGLCIPLWAVFPPLQVVLSSACSVASLSRFPSHYLPGHPHLREGALAAYLFGQGSPSTWCTGRTAVHDTPSAKLPCGAQRGVTLPR